MSFYSYQIEGPLTSTIPRSQPGFVSTSFPPSLPQHEDEIAIPPVSNDDHAAALPKPPRPPNAWILYRSETIRKLKEANSPLLETSQSELSKRIAEQWKNETPDVKKWFEREAEIKKLEHAKMHPGYVFKPKRTAKSRSPGKRSTPPVSPPMVSSPLAQEFQSPLPHPQSQYVQLQQRSPPYHGEFSGSYESEDDDRVNSTEIMGEGDRSRTAWEKENSSQYNYPSQMAPMNVLSSSPGYDHYPHGHMAQTGYEMHHGYEMYDANSHEGYNGADCPRSNNYQDVHSQRSGYPSVGPNGYYQRPNQSSVYNVGSSYPQEEYPTRPPNHVDYTSGAHYNPNRESQYMNNYQFPVRY